MAANVKSTPLETTTSLRSDPDRKFKEAAMRGMTQKWIVLKKDETVWDVVFDAVIALLGAAIITQIIHSLLSVL